MTMNAYLNLATLKIDRETNGDETKELNVFQVKDLLESAKDYLKAYKEEFGAIKSEESLAKQAKRAEKAKAKAFASSLKLLKVAADGGDGPLSKIHYNGKGLLETMSTAVALSMPYQLGDVSGFLNMEGVDGLPTEENVEEDLFSTFPDIEARWKMIENSVAEWEVDAETAATNFDSLFEHVVSKVTPREYKNLRHNVTFTMSEHKLKVANVPVTGNLEQHQLDEINAAIKGKYKTVKTGYEGETIEAKFDAKAVQTAIDFTTYNVADTDTLKFNLVPVKGAYLLLIQATNGNKAMVIGLK